MSQFDCHTVQRLPPSRLAGRKALLLLVALLVGVMFGCQAQRPGDPITVMLDRSRGVSQRLTAAEQLGEVARASEERVINARCRNWRGRIVSRWNCAGMRLIA